MSWAGLSYELLIRCPLYNGYGMMSSIVYGVHVDSDYVVNFRGHRQFVRQVLEVKVRITMWTL